MPSTGKTKVLITDGMAKNGLDVLLSHHELEVEHRNGVDPKTLAEILPDFDCVVVRSATTLTPELIEKGKSLKLIVRAGTGVDNIDLPSATKRNIPVMNTASANSLAAAEHTLALIFALLRQIPTAADSLRKEKWDRKSFKGVELTGKTLGIVGFGNIGRLVARRALGLEMKVCVFDPMVKNTDLDLRLIDDLDALLSEAQILTLHVPFNDRTRNLINTDSLAKMRKGAYLINCARGGVVDEAAVISALESGQLAGAAFDVFEKEPPDFPNPLFTHPKILAVPHLGAMTHESQERVAITAAEQIVGYFKNGDRKGIINL